MDRPLRFRPGPGISVRYEPTTGQVDIWLTRPQIFVARIDSSAAAESGSGSGSGNSTVCGAPHGWTEMTPGNDGCGYVEKPGGRTGTTSVNPAYELNGNQLDANTLVYLIERGFNGRDNSTVYDILSAGATSSGSGSGVECGDYLYVDVVTGVCPSSGSGS